LSGGLSIFKWWQREILSNEIAFLRGLAFGVPVGLAPPKRDCVLKSNMCCPAGPRNSLLAQLTGHDWTCQSTGWRDEDHWSLESPTCRCRSYRFLFPKFSWFFKMFNLDFTKMYICIIDVCCQRFVHHTCKPAIVGPLASHLCNNIVIFFVKTKYTVFRLLP